MKKMAAAAGRPPDDGELVPAATISDHLALITNSCYISIITISEDEVHVVLDLPIDSAGSC
jgi:hypothetical protein